MKTPKLVLILFILLNLTVVGILYLDSKLTPPSTLKLYLPLALNISYSIIASCVFYCIVVYIPHRKKRIELLLTFNRKIVLIDDIIKELVSNLKLTPDDCLKSKIFEQRLKEIDTSLPIQEYENWYSYLFFFKQKLSDTIGSIIIFHEYLEENSVSELLMIQNRLLVGQLTFQGYNILLTKSLAPASIDLQEIIVHNNILQKYWGVEYKKNEKKIDKLGKQYRKSNYGEK